MEYEEAGLMISFKEDFRQSLNVSLKNKLRQTLEFYGLCKVTQFKNHHLAYFFDIVHATHLFANHFEHKCMKCVVFLIISFIDGEQAKNATKCSLIFRTRKTISMQVIAFDPKYQTLEVVFRFSTLRINIC
jgi:hypothetical protein